jgi:hypothetical protein
VDREEYQPNLIKCWLLASLSEDIPTSEMLRLISAAETIGPMIDRSSAMTEDKKIIEAVATLRAAFLKLKAEHPELARARLA